MLIRSLVIVCLLFTVLLPAQSLLASVPDLYLDRVYIWSPNSSVHSQTTGGYDFGISWRQGLPAVHSTALGFYNFKSGVDQIISFRVELINATTTGSVLNLQPVGVNAGIIYMAFSIMVITSSSSAVMEIVTVSDYNMTIGSSPLLYANSTLFDFNSSAPSYDVPFVDCSFQWVTGEGGVNNSYNINYWTSVHTYYYWDNPSYQLEVAFYEGSSIYMTGAKINIILGTKYINGSEMARYYHNANVGADVWVSYSYDLGVDTSLFHPPSTGQSCYNGLLVIDLYLYATSNNLSTELYFEYSNATVPDITSITTNYLYECEISTICYGMCPQGQYFSGGYCQNCNNSIPYCAICIDSYNCITCLPTLTYNSSLNQCVCPPRNFYNSFIPSCEPCSFDCFTCSSNNGSCLTCNAADFRELVNSRCVPLPGYYETNTTIAGQCINNCINCTSATNCHLCDVYYYKGVSKCLACPYDCYTCDSSGNCLSCNITTDFRYLNGSRCLPLDGYYESYFTKAGKCQWGCLQCTSGSSCQMCRPNMSLLGQECECDPGFFVLFSSGKSFCQQCHFSCYRCFDYSEYGCLECKAADFRNISGSQCFPMSGYYESNISMAGKCSLNCQLCSSATFCYQCEPRFVFNYGTYFNNSVLGCVACPYDCEACYPGGGCSLCNVFDNRVINITSQRCEPMPGYYDNGVAIAVACQVGCLVCTSTTNCVTCDANFSLSGGLCYGNCPVRTYANTSNPTNSTCQRCPYDCYTCNSNGGCLSCLAADFRQLIGSRCLPLTGYYQDNQEVAAQCPSQCSVCSSASACSSCSSGFQLQGAACLNNCPTNNPYSTSNNPSTCQDLMPGLYLDKISLWSANGSVHPQTAGGYSFPLTWRSTLPGVFGSALGLFNFATGPHQVLSFQAELVNMTTSGASVLMNPSGVDAGVVYLAFSVLVLTGNNSNIEMLVLTAPTLSSRQSVVLTANSSLFDFGTNNKPFIVGFYQWLTGVDYNVTGDYYNYWSYLNWYTYSPSSGVGYELRVSFSRGGQIYIAGVKVVLLLVGHTVGNSSTAIYWRNTQSGRNFWHSFQPNLGVPTHYFGQPSTGQSCFSGLDDIDLYVYHNNHYPSGSSFFFYYSGNNITALSWNYIYGCGIKTVCLAQCPSGTYFDQHQSCLPCSSSIPNCLTCSSAGICLSCADNLTLSDYGTSCDCQPQHFYNSFIPACEPCPFYCKACSDNATCLSCNYSDFRVLSGSMCVPRQGYYETNVSMAGQCIAGCSVCSSGSDCSQCKVSFFLASNPVSCQACPYDCYTCDSNGSCLSCNSQADHRFLNGTRCYPEPGYFQNNATTAGSCSQGCLECLDSNICLTCDRRHKLANGVCSCGDGFFSSYWRGCSPCDPLCVTCSFQATFCDSCNASHNRYLVGYDCVPMVGYYSISTSLTAVPCSSNCLACHSSNYCYQCSLMHTFNYALYQNSSNLFCEPCPYYCSDCYTSSRCSICNASDFRVMNRSNFICQPFPGYFDNGVAMAVQCEVGCLNCTSLYACTLCISSFSLNGGLCYGSCPVRTYSTIPNSVNSTCKRCPYDCYTCSSNGNCLSCSSSVDFRQLSGVRCVPIAGYYESNQTIAFKCPFGCAQCISAANCSSCDSLFTFHNWTCQTYCPTNNSLSTSLDPNTCQDLMPNLYLDRIVLWSTDGTASYRATPGGYSFPLTWRYSIPTIFASGLGIQTFKTAPYSSLSYIAELVNTTTSGGVIYFNPVSSLSGIMFLSFSVVVIPQSTADMELITLSAQNLTVGDTHGLAANSSNFNFTGGQSDPIMTYFYQWVTGDVPIFDSSQINYWTTTFVITFAVNSTYSPHEIVVEFMEGWDIYKTGVKVVVLLVAKVINQYDTAFYQNSIHDGLVYFRSFATNLGVPTAFFGNPSSGISCITGLRGIDLYVSNSTFSNQSSSFLFTYSGIQITNLTYQYIYGCSATTLCLARCPPRYFFNSKTALCMPCPFDCGTCNNNQDCLTCNPTDFRQISGTRCVPLPGYYQSNSAVSLKCAAGCTSCTSASNCSACSGSYNLQESTCVAAPSSSSMLPIIVGVVVGIVVAVGVVLGVIYYKAKVAAAGTTTGGEGDMVDVPKSDGIMVESVDIHKQPSQQGSVSGSSSVSGSGSSSVSGSRSVSGSVSGSAQSIVSSEYLPSNSLGSKIEDI